MKKILSLILAIILVTTALYTVAFATQKGDVDGNGKITAVDARLILQYVAGLKTEGDLKNATNADIDGNGKITAVDARIVLQIVAGLVETPTHTHSFSEPTCTEPAKCSCGATNGSTISHNYKDGICLMCKKADSTAKSSEIAKENERHTQKLAELKESRDYLVGLNKDRINSIKSTYGISYVYDNATCVSKISSLDSQISDLDFEISRLELYNDPADRKRIAELKSERNELESQKTTYEQMRKIHDYEYAIESHEYEYQRKVAAENDLHQENLAKIETKYAS